MAAPYEGDSNNVAVPGITGRSKGNDSKGVLGVNDSGTGVFALSTTGHGLDAFSDTNIAVYARGGLWAGVFDGDIVVGKGMNPNPPLGGSIAINDGHLYVNDGSVHVRKGDVLLETAGDCAEYFDIANPKSVEPGTVMVITEEEALEISSKPYDPRVAGVVSGAGDCRPGILLDGQRLDEHRLPIALMGKVYCKVDAGGAPVRVGDMLTTSATPGHAMRASDPARAFGAVIGKALRPLYDGLGLVPVLVALQ